ncbi:MAG: RNA-binding protein [Thermodesulfovibrionales bacterium]|nr:RNA-binding protein [Thermodesulfovibrionales bacterium]
MSNKLFVGNVSFRASEDDLKDLFTKAGEVLSAKLVKDPATGRSKGFGFVEMANSADADKAIQMFNGSNFMERNLVVDKAKPRQPQRGSRNLRQRSERRRES